VKSTWRFLTLVYPDEFPLYEHPAMFLSALEEDTLLRRDTGYFDMETQQHLEYIRKVDWASTPLGPIGSWPTSVHQMINFIMADQRPSAIYLGPTNIIIYNVAYSIVAGDRHPRILGCPLEDAWPEAWPIMSENMSKASDKVRLEMEDVQLFLNHHG